MKVAVTDLLAVRFNTQLAVPVHAPLHPVKVEPTSGVAVRVTVVPWGKVAEHVAPQSMPAGLLVTVPEPVPVLPTVTVRTISKVAVTVVSALIAKVHVPVPVQPPPLHPVKVELAPAVAVRITDVFGPKPAEQVAPQSMPPGLLVTVPEPAPALITVRILWTGALGVTAEAGAASRAATIVAARTSDMDRDMERMARLKLPSLCPICAVDIHYP